MQELQHIYGIVEYAAHSMHAVNTLRAAFGTAAHIRIEAFVLQEVMQRWERLQLLLEYTMQHTCHGLGRRSGGGGGGGANGYLSLVLHNFRRESG